MRKRERIRELILRWVFRSTFCASKFLLLLLQLFSDSLHDRIRRRCRDKILWSKNIIFLAAAAADADVAGGGEKDEQVVVELWVKDERHRFSVFRKLFPRIVDGAAAAAGRSQRTRSTLRRRRWREILHFYSSQKRILWNDPAFAEQITHYLI